MIENTRIEWKDGHSLQQYGGDDSFFALFDANVEMESQLDMLDEARVILKALHEDPLVVMQEDMDDDDDEDDEDDDDEDDDDEDDDDDDDDDEDDHDDDDDDDDNDENKDAN